MRNKEAIATVVGCDISDVEPYQSTRIRGMYQCGDNFYTVKPGANPKPPTLDGRTWEPMTPQDWFTRKYNKTVFVAKPEERYEKVRN